ncbi:MAG: ketose-bisphosphate aldolase, partial [Oscillospiraceae bacterium]
AAAEALRSPVIIGTAEDLLPFASLQELAPLLGSMAQRATVPVVLHFDHGLTEECIYEAIDLGFSSVMYDCSTLPFEENLQRVKQMARYAHGKGVSVEAELGHVGANSGSAEGTGGDDSIFTDPQQALSFVRQTEVDALAIAIGTAHGAYKSTPKLNFEILHQSAGLLNTPLVLHGGSGLSDSDFEKTIAGGISKINIFTDINMAAAEAAYNSYRPAAGCTDLMLPMVQAVQAATQVKMKLFGSGGRC